MLSRQASHSREKRHSDLPFSPLDTSRGMDPLQQTRGSHYVFWKVTCRCFILFWERVNGEWRSTCQETSTRLHVQVSSFEFPWTPWILGHNLWTWSTRKSVIVVYGRPVIRIQAIYILPCFSFYTYCFIQWHSLHSLYENQFLFLLNQSVVKLHPYCWCSRS